ELARRSTIAVRLTFFRMMFVSRLRVVLSSPIARVSSAMWCEKAGKFDCPFMSRTQCARLSSLDNRRITALETYRLKSMFNDVAKKRLSSSRDPGVPALANCGPGHCARQWRVLAGQV